MFKTFYCFVNRKLNLRQLVSYGVVGFIGAVVDIGLLNVFVQFTSLDVYDSLVLAFLTSVFVCYYLHSRWTFKVKKQPMKFIVYALSSIVGLIINFTVMYLLIEGLDWWYNYAKLAAIFVAVIWNYVMAKTLIFNVTK